MLVFLVGFALCCIVHAADVVSDFKDDGRKRHQPAKISWNDLTVVNNNQSIIKIPSGEIGSGRLLGILGPSGSGKSTFLRVLGSRLSKNLKQTGEVAYICNGGSKTLNDDDIAFVHQDDTFFAMLSVRETLELALALQINSVSLDRKREREEDNSIVTDVINIMGLSKVANSRVGSMGGGEHHHGISGGERKRLSVASELLANPLLLIADEPTSGLDSFQALQVIQILRDLAVKNNIISVCTIHQPRSSIWSLFDDIFLLTPLGKVAYHGPREEAISYFKRIGYTCPSSTNPAEFLIDLVSIDTTSPEAVATSHKRIEAITRHFEEHKRKHVHNSTGGKEVQFASIDASDSFSPGSGDAKKGLGRFLQTSWRSVRRFSLLFGRAAKQTLRDSKVNLVRTVVSGLLAMVVSSVYGHQGPQISPSSISSRVNIIAQGSINVAMLSMIKTLQLFKKERSVIDRERAQNEYRAVEYLLAKACAELPLDAVVGAVFGYILHSRTNLSCSRDAFVKTLSLLSAACSSLGLAVGALAPTGDIALAVGPALMVVYVIMGAIGPAGLGVAKLPSVLRPFRDFSPLKWACEALCSAEFKGKDLVFTVVESKSSSAAVQPVSKQPASTRSFFGRLASLPPVLLIGKVLSQVFARTVAVKEGDNVLKTLGITNASYVEGVSVLWKMLGSHMLLALCGLVMSRSQE